MNANDIKTATIIGAGTMGAGFAMCFAVAGIETRLYDLGARQLEAGLGRIDNALNLFMREGLLESEQVNKAQKRISTFTSLDDSLAGSQFVLEAAPEELQLKRDLFVEMERLMDKDTILATNSSALTVSDVAAKCSRQEMICGMHWFNPPELVPLVEVIPGSQTKGEVAQLVYDLIYRLRHVPIMVKKEIAGFVGNRMQLALFREAMNILQEGAASPEDIDKAVKYGLGFRWSFMGPLLTADFGGLDIWGRVAAYLFPRLSNSDQVPDVLIEKMNKGKLGVKAGEGLFVYQGDEALKAVKRRDLYFIRELRLQEELGQD